MGLLGGSTVVVGSSVYNMAGDIEERPDFLKSLVASNVISNSRFSMGETITGGYLNGPSMKARAFYRWAANPLRIAGLVPRVDIRVQMDFDIAGFASFIPYTGTRTIEMQRVGYDYANIKYWARQWMYMHRQDRMELHWEAFYDQSFDMSGNATGQGTLIIAYPTGSGFADDVIDGSTQPFETPIMPGYYFYATYALKSDTGKIAPRMWIYQVGSGILDLDALIYTSTRNDTFLPWIPVRLDGDFLSEDYLPDGHALVKKAYKKMTNGQRYNKLLDQLNENEDIDDIDFIYVVNGVNLNTKEPMGRRYLFEFFDRVRLMKAEDGLPEPGDLGYNNYVNIANTTYEDGILIYDTNRKADMFDPLADEPDSTYAADTTMPRYPVKPVSSLDFNTSPLNIFGGHRLRMKVDWAGMTKITGAGLKKPGAKKGECWLTIGGSTTATGGLVQGSKTSWEVPTFPDNTIEIHHQIDEDNWATIQIISLTHENLIYKDKSVLIEAKEALLDDEDSGFIIPLHYETLREMSMVHSTQLMLSSSWLVLNYYDIVKQPWYATGAFKILLVIAVIAFTIATGGTGAFSVGLLGSSASVGAALGATGIAAVVVGAVANAVAAMLLTTLITKGATMIFGAKIGAIIGAIASVIALNVGTGFMNGMSVSQVWGSMMSAPNLINLTSAVGKGITGYMQASAQELIAKTEDLLKQYEKQSEDLTKQYLDTFGYGTFAYDPTMLTDTAQYFVESSDTFLSRTLLTGSEIAEMSIDMLHNFSDLTLALDTSIR